MLAQPTAAINALTSGKKVLLEASLDIATSVMALGDSPASHEARDLGRRLDELITAVGRLAAAAAGSEGTC